VGIESKVYDTLSGSAAVVAIVGTKIYPDHRTQYDGLPAIIFYRTPGGERINSLTGYDSLENAIIEIAVQASAVDGRRALGDVVTAAMTGSTRFSCILPDPPYDDYDDETGIYERLFDFSVWNAT